MSNKIEKIVSFRAEDNGTSSLVDKLREKAKQYRDEIVSAAAASSKTSSEFVKNLEKELQVIERRDKALREQKRKSIMLERDTAVWTTRDEVEKMRSGELPIVSHSGNPKLRKSAHNYFQTMTSEDYHKAQMETQELNAKGAINAIDADAGEEMRKLAVEGELQSKLLRELIEESKRNNKEVIDENNFDEAKSNAPGGSNSPTPPGGGGGGGGSSWGNITKGVLVADIIKGLSTRVGSGALNEETGEQFAEVSMWKSIPLIGNLIGGSKERYYQNSLARQKSIAKLMGLTGDTGMTLLGNTSIGIDDTEGTNFMEQFLRRRGGQYNNRSGTASGGTNIDLMNLLNISKAYSIDESQLINGSKNDMAMGYGGSISNVVLDLFGKLKSGGALGMEDTKMVRLLEIQNQLIEEQTTVVETVNSGALNSQIAAFQNIGGSFSDPNRLGSRISSISSSLKNPQNEYMKSMQYASLLELNPNASYLDILKGQEQGLGTPGYFRKMMELVQRRNKGNKAGGAIETSKMFGLSYSAGEQLYNNISNFKESDFANLNQDQIQRLLGDAATRAQTFTPEREREAAENANAFSKGVIDGWGNLFEQIVDNLKKIVTSNDETQTILRQKVAQPQAIKN